MEKEKFAIPFVQEKGRSKNRPNIIVVKPRLILAVHPVFDQIVNNRRIRKG